LNRVSAEKLGRAQRFDRAIGDLQFPTIMFDFSVADSPAIVKADSQPREASESGH